MTSCDVCGQPTRVVVPFHAKPAATVLDDLTNPNRHLPRSALSAELNAAIPWGTHPDDDRFGQACEDCARAMQDESKDNATDGPHE